MESYPVDVLQRNFSYNDQFGCTKGSATLDAQLETLQPLYAHLDNHCYVPMVLY
jgi:hypothetical protein